MATPSGEPRTKRLTASVDEAAEILGVSPNSIRNWARDGKLTSIRLGSRLMFSLKVLDRIVSGELKIGEEK